MKSMCKSSVLFILCACALNSYGEQGYKTIPNGIITGNDKNDVKIEWYSPTSVRIVRQQSGYLAEDKKSLVVISEPEKVKFRVDRKNDVVSVASSDLRLDYDVICDCVTFYDRHTGKELLKEEPESAVFTPVSDNGRYSYAVAQTFRLDANEPVFGLGQHRHGLWNQRGSSQHLCQENREIAIPLVQSPKGYALYWDNYSITDFNDNSDGMTFSSATGDIIDYYFIYGGSADKNVAEIRNLTGSAPMYPLWAYGYHQSRERYVSQDELVGTVKRYRELGVPLDGIIQDWRYWGDDFYKWNAVQFLNPEFPDPKGMMDKIHALNAHATISIWPSFGPATDIYKQFDKEGKLMPHKTYPQDGDTRVYNPYDKRARDIYWSFFKNNMVPIGMDGWWLDATEPEHSPIEEKDYDYETGIGTFRSLRNAFPLVSVGGVYDNHRRDYDGKRVFILTRSAFAGQQRYGAQSWSGDIEASWETLRRQIPAALNFSLCGIPYWNSDIGGFYTWRDFPEGLNDPEYRELYTRWIQFGAFTGMMRSHGTNCPREIWQFGNPGDSVYDAIHDAIDMRYRLLPYIYSVAWDVTSAGASIMRPLYADFAFDKTAIRTDDQYLFGKSLLVAPVVKPVRNRCVYLPMGCNWIDFWDGKLHLGGSSVMADAPIDRIPIFVRAGSIIPVGPQVQYAAEKPWDNIELRVYPGADAEFSLYEDEGDNYNYEKGKYSIIRMKWNDRKRTLTILDREGSFDTMMSRRSFRLVLVGADNGIGFADSSNPKEVTYSGKKLKVKL